MHIEFPARPGARHEEADARRPHELPKVTISRQAAPHPRARCAGYAVTRVPSGPGGAGRTDHDTARRLGLLVRRLLVPAPGTLIKGLAKSTPGKSSVSVDLEVRLRPLALADAAAARWGASSSILPPK